MLPEASRITIVSEKRPEKPSEKSEENRSECGVEKRRGKEKRKNWDRVLVTYISRRTEIEWKSST
jgi:hypothetical protein